MCSVAPSSRPIAGTRVAALLPLAFIALRTHCSDPACPVILTPLPTPNTVDRASMQRLAFVLDVDLSSGRIAVSPVGAPLHGASALVPSAGTPTASAFSLLGAGVVDLLTSNYAAGAIGAVSPGEIAIRFDLRVRNLLSASRLVTPTFPAPPAGATGVQLFPFSITV